MKLWKILLATMIAMLLVCAVAMADEETEEVCPHIPSEWKVLSQPTCTEGSVDVKYWCTRPGCDWNDVVFDQIQHDNALGHNWTVLSGGKAATCTAEGTKNVKCLRCGITETWVVDKIDHDMKAYAELSTPATCTKEGSTVYQCRVCEYTEVKTIKPTGHTFNVYVEAKPATCAAAGYTEHRKCANCDATELKNIVPATSTHTNPVKVDENSVAATCYTDGVDYFYCKTCGAEYSKVVKATGAHSVKKVNAKAPTCTDDGYTEHWACTTKGCTYTSDKVVVPATGAAHDWKANGKREPTCTVKGVESQICSICKDIRYINEVAALGHDHSILVENVLPTCETKGYQAMKCSRCSDIKYNAIAELAHNYIDTRWTVKKAANCLSTGLEANVCTMCNGAEITRVIEAKGHVLPKNPYVAKAATCTEDGLGLKKCANCSYEETVVIKATNHKNSRDVVVAAATCDRPGMKHVFCDDCQKYIESNIIIDPKGHDGKVTEYVAPTCTAEGKKTTECKNCNKTVTEKLAKLPHDYEWEHAVKPSMAGDGKDVYICQVCDHIADTKVIKYTKWYYNNTMTSFGPTTKELVGGNDWYRVTPIDVTVDGVYTYDLIASNRYVVGSVTITVNAGVLTVSYDVAASHIDVKDEAMYIYASKADLAAGTAVTANVGAAINVAETFGDDAKVIVSLVLTGDYNAAGHNVSSMIIDDAEIAAMIANID